MPSKCVVAECHSVGGIKGLQFSPFSKRSGCSFAMGKAVDNQGRNWKGPTDASLICSKHFELDCYEQDYRKELGFPSKWRCLKPDAIEDMHINYLNKNNQYNESSCVPKNF